MHASRIRDLRKRAGLTQADLAQRLGVDTSLISRWEKGEREPSPQQTMDIARAVGVTLDFLLNAQVQPRFMLRGAAPRGMDENHEVRRAITDAEQQIHFLHTVYETAGKPPRKLTLKYDLSAVPEPDLPDFAAELRGVLRLNHFVTLDELKQALRDHNLHVFEWAMPSNLSGMSYRGAFTVIFINALQPKPRRLFTLAHELAHVLFHLDDEQGPGIVSLFSRRDDREERQANQFAAELLMPLDQVNVLKQQMAGRLRTPEGLESLAQMFNVSRDAMFYRLATQRFYDWSEKKRFFSERPIRDDEPIQYRVDDIAGQVSPEFLHTALELYDAGLISAGKLAEWCFASRITTDAYLSDRYFEVASLIV